MKMIWWDHENDHVKSLQVLLDCRKIFWDHEKMLWNHDKVL